MIISRTAGRNVLNDVRKFDLTKRFRHLFVDRQQLQEHVQSLTDENPFFGPHSGKFSNY